MHGQYLQKLLKILGKRRTGCDQAVPGETGPRQGQDSARRQGQALNAGFLIPHNFTHVI